MSISVRSRMSFTILLIIFMRRHHQQSFPLLFRSRSRTSPLVGKASYLGVHLRDQGHFAHPVSQWGIQMHGLCCPFWLSAHETMICLQIYTSTRHSALHSSDSFQGNDTRRLVSANTVQASLTTPTSAFTTASASETRHKQSCCCRCRCGRCSAATVVFLIWGPHLAAFLRSFIAPSPPPCGLTKRTSPPSRTGCASAMHSPFLLS